MSFWRLTAELKYGTTDKAAKIDVQFHTHLKTDRQHPTPSASTSNINTFHLCNFPSAPFHPPSSSYIRSGFSAHIICVSVWASVAVARTHFWTPNRYVRTQSRHAGIFALHRANIYLSGLRMLPLYLANTLLYKIISKSPSAWSRPGSSGYAYVSSRSC